MKLYLRPRASQIRTEHDRPRGIVRELLSGGLETVLEKLDVATTAVAALLVLDLVLDNERLLGEVDGVVEGSGDGVVGSLSLCYETLVAFKDGLEGILDFPLADIAGSLGADWGLLGRLGGRPTLSPVVRELLDEGSLDGSRLKVQHT